MLFCTYFDSKYLSRGSVCHRTLMEKSEGRANMLILAMDDITLRNVNGWFNVTAIQLSDIEVFCPNLLTVKPKRQLKEYYATISPVLPQIAMDMFPKEKIIWYTDADIAFWGPPEEMISEMGDASVLVTPHEHPHSKAAGLFNVGILGYRNDADGLGFLRWWEQKCLEWCEWRYLPDGRCADQGYLNIFQENPGAFNGMVSKHPGINLGPWNLALHLLEEKGGQLTLDGDKNLICYHYHGFKETTDGGYKNDTGWDVSDKNHMFLYRPYHKLLKKADSSSFGDL